jgi:DNA mismatch endonuclease, patch repair protein
LLDRNALLLIFNKHFGENAYFCYTMDVHDKATRSYNMSQIKGKNTKPEIFVRIFLFSKGFRFRLHDKKLPGKPDIILPKYKTVIFVNGCFWHGHENCKYFVVPKTRSDWWQKKIENTRMRDLESKIELIEKGWDVIEIWECNVKGGHLNEIILKLR